MSFSLDENKKWAEYSNISTNYPNAETMYQRALTANRSTLDLILNIIFGNIRTAAQNGEFSVDIEFKRDRSPEDDLIVDLMDNRFLHRYIMNQLKIRNYQYDQSYTSGYWKLDIYWGYANETKN